MDLLDVRKASLVTYYRIAAIEAEAAQEYLLETVEMKASGCLKLFLYWIRSILPHHCSDSFRLLIHSFVACEIGS
jgi:hypothetical protein